MSYFIGIDLGTTYTAAAIYRNSRASIFSLGGRSASIPSVVLLREDETVLTGDAAVRRAITEPERVAREFKRRLGDTTPIIVGGSPYSAEALMSRLLKSVLEEVEKREGEPPSGIAISHPANWGPYKIDLLKQAVRLAGLDTDAVVLLTEPEAAVISYASQERVEPGEVVAVYDLGGGTFDAAVLRRTEEGFEIIGKPEGIERLGGIDFDAAVFAHVARSLDGALQQLDPEDPAAQAAMARLRQDCVDAKEALSADTDATIPVLLPHLQTDVRITRREFESLIRPSLVDSIDAMRRALASAGVTPDEVSRVLLVGGSSRTPLIAQLVSSELGRPVAVDAHPKHAVALGAAHAASGTIGADTAAAPAVDRPGPTTPPTPEQPGSPSGKPQSSAPAPMAAAPKVEKPLSAPIFEEPPPNIPAGVPIVPSIPEPPAQAPPAQAPPVQRPSTSPPVSASPPPSASKKPDIQETQALPKFEPPPRLVETPAAVAEPLTTPYGELGGAAAPGSPSEPVSGKGRGPLIGVLVGVLLLAAVGGYFLLSGDDGDIDTGQTASTNDPEITEDTTSGDGTTSSTEAGDDPDGDTTTVPGDSTTTSTDGTSGTIVPDAELVAAVEIRLESTVTDLDVKVTQGTATIAGFVETDQARLAAKDIVSGVPGVGLVINNLTAAPADEWCSEEIKAHDRWACISDAVVSGGVLEATFEFSDADEPFNTSGGFHLHVFGSDVAPINAGANGEESVGGGTWLIWDKVPDLSIAIAQVFAGGVPEKVCVRIASPTHSLASLESGNCTPITIVG